jgi:hypothetical protein
LAGKAVTLSNLRGREIAFANGQRSMVTIHPSSIVRAPDGIGRHQANAGLVKDLKPALKTIGGLPKAA